MTNYEKKLKEMTVDKMARLMNATDECVGVRTGEDFERHVPEGMSCVQCIKKWLMQESEEGL